MADKQCTKCKQVLPIEQFYQNARDGLLSNCKPCRAAYVRERRLKNPDAYRSWRKEYRSKNREKLNARTRELRAVRPEQGKAYNKRWRQKDPARALLVAARSRAARYGIEFSIAREDIVIPDCCPVLGIPFGPNTDRGPGAFKDSMSLDRIDPCKGYIPGNVQVLSRLANTMKSNATAEELVAFADWVRRKYG